MPSSGEGDGGPCLSVRTHRCQRDASLCKHDDRFLCRPPLVDQFEVDLAILGLPQVRLTSDV
jgi:hypothetical protein